MTRESTEAGKWTGSLLFGWAFLAEEFVKSLLK